MKPAALRRRDEERLLEQAVEHLRRALRIARGEKTPDPQELSVANRSESTEDRRP